MGGRFCLSLVLNRQPVSEGGLQSPGAAALLRTGAELKGTGEETDVNKQTHRLHFIVRKCDGLVECYKWEICTFQHLWKV